MEDFKPLDLFGDGIAQKNKSTDLESEMSNPNPNTYSDIDLMETSIEALTDTELADENSENEDANQTPDDTPIKDDNNVIIDRMSTIESSCEDISAKLSTLEQLFNKKIMHADYEDKVIDQMHSELQKYKEDLYSQLVRPILLDIIEVRDSIIRIAATYQKKPESERDIPNKTFADYSYDLQDILEKKQRSNI